MIPHQQAKVTRLAYVAEVKLQIAAISTIVLIIQVLISIALKKRMKWKSSIANSLSRIGHEDLKFRPAGLTVVSSNAPSMTGDDASADCQP
jgi:hypothetical protein